LGFDKWAGSDVANLRTTARREGDYFVVDGQKKFITGGGSANWMTTAVRTGSAEDGAAGVSLLLVPLDLPGVTVRRLKTQGWWGSYAAHITLENVRVPAKNIVGEENMGFLIIMENFNMERISLIVQSLRMSRICLEDAITYARGRQTFGKKLISHQVIRHKLADMAREIEGAWAWLENVAERYQAGADPVQVCVGGFADFDLVLYLWEHCFLTLFFSFSRVCLFLSFCFGAARAYDGAAEGHGHPRAREVRAGGVAGSRR
jgi:acyl-CoA dehydrogenase